MPQSRSSRAACGITTKAPEPDKWDGQRSANGMVRVFKCKPLACPDAATVTNTFLKSPTRHPDPQALDLWLDVNGTRRQRGNTRTMIFPVAEIVSYLEVGNNYLHEGDNHETHHNRICFGVRALSHGRVRKPGSPQVGHQERSRGCIDSPAASELG